MLVNQEEITSHVEFVSYTGKWPNLCNGELTLKINGERYKFGNCCKYPRFWSVSEGEWAIDVSELPEELRKYATEIDAVFNTNVEHGHCGGCI